MPGKIKLTEEFIKAFEEVVNEYQFSTDEELLFMTNQKLPKRDRITDRTFKRWKNEGHQEDNPYYERLHELIMVSRIKQKQRLFEAMFDSDGNKWTRYAWTIERKFSDWNLKRITENTLKASDEGPITFNINLNED